MEGNTLLYVTSWSMVCESVNLECGVEITEFHIYEISCVGHFHIFISVPRVLNFNEFTKLSTGK